MAELRERTEKILAENGSDEPEGEGSSNIWEIIISFLRRLLDDLLRFMGG